MYRFRLFSAAILLLLAASGCKQSDNRPAQPATDVRAIAHSIVLCQTTEAELRTKLGAPTRDGIFHKAHVVSWITQMDSPSRYLAVLLDDRGVVVDLYWDIPTEVPWTPTSQCAESKETR